jgi:hypothetical protein
MKGGVILTTDNSCGDGKSGGGKGKKGSVSKTTDKTTLANRRRWHWQRLAPSGQHDP